MKKRRLPQESILVSLTAAALALCASAETISFAPDGARDRTAEVRAAIERARRGGTLEFAKGVYHFHTNAAATIKGFRISNHDHMEVRPVFLDLRGVRGLTLKGGGSTFVFHGEGLGALVMDAANVRFEGVKLDWARPFISEAEIVSFENGGTVLRLDAAKWPHHFVKGRGDEQLVLDGDGWSCPAGAGMLFEKSTYNIVERSCDVQTPPWVKRRKDGLFRMGRDYSRCGAGAKAGDILALRPSGRPCPAVALHHAKDVVFEDVVIHTAHGMGVLAQMSENFTWRGTGRAEDRTSGVFPPEGSGRVTTLHADATHFSNVKGSVLVENCLFETMMDDAINVHSTCLGVQRVEGRTLFCRFMHPQAMGFRLFAAGDRLRFIKGRTLENGPLAAVASVKSVSVKDVEITLAEDVPQGYGAGDAVENADFQCAATFRRNIVRNNRARGALFTTPHPVVVEDNLFDNVSGSAILLAGDAQGWYESGACEDVIIRGNTFRNCLTSKFQFCDGIISSWPMIREPENQRRHYHRNVRIEGNLFETFDVPILYARSTDDLVFTNNVVRRNGDHRSWSRRAFDVADCDRASIEGGETEWRRLAFLPPPAPGAKTHRHIVNLGRTDWPAMLPLKLVMEGVEGGAFAFRMNGKALGEVRAAPYEVLVPEKAIKGETENELEIDVLAPPSKPASRIVMSGTYPSVKGPLLSERDFFTRCLDVAIPALAPIPGLVAAGDMAGARKIFSDHVRRTLRPELVIGEWLSETNSAARRRALKAKAAQIMRREISTLGCTWQFENGNVEWEFNPTFNGYREWNYHTAYFDCANPLAELYLHSRDEALARSWRELFLSFISYNPVPIGRGPGSTKCWRSLDSSCRTLMLSRQLNALISSPVFDDELVVTFFRSMWEHGRRLRTGHAYGGNWLTNEMSSLARISFLYPFFKDAPEWRAYSMDRLQKELEWQVYPDGFQSELASGYHCGVITHFLWLVEMADDYGATLPPEYRSGVERMFEIFTHLSRPDLRVPGVNDSGDVKAGPQMRKAVRFFPHRADFKWFATDRREGRPPEWLSCEMPYSGFAALRDSWNADGVWAFLDGAPFGMAHQHEDKLNVLMSAYGRNMIVEAGTYAYDTSDMRRYVLSTRSHNTIRIDGFDQNRLKGYRWHREDIAKKAGLVFRTSPARDWADAVYDEGYGPAKIAVKHARRLIFHKAEASMPPFFVVVDRISSPDSKSHSFEQIWHLETCTCELRPDSFTADFSGVGLAGAFSATGLVDKIGQYKPELQGWMPIFKEGPHEHRAVHTPTLTGEFTGARRIVTVFMPFRGGKSPLKGVKASPDPAANDYTLILADGSERVCQEP